MRRGILLLVALGFAATATAGELTVDPEEIEYQEYLRKKRARLGPAYQLRVDLRTVRMTAPRKGAVAVPSVFGGILTFFGVIGTTAVNRAASNGNYYNDANASRDALIFGTVLIGGIVLLAYGINRAIVRRNRLDNVDHESLRLISRFHTEYERKKPEPIQGG